MAPQENGAPAEAPKQEEEAKSADVEMAKEEPKAEAAEAADEPKEEAQATTEDVAAEKPKEPEPPKEAEEDAKEDKRKKLAAGAARISESDSTLNVLPTAGGKLLMSLKEGGFQYLLAGARATVGIKSGRYMFETVFISGESAEVSKDSKGKAPVFRLGFSTSGSSLFLSDPDTSFAFDQDAVFVKTKKRVAKKFQKGQAIAVLLNLEAGSANENTVSLFVDGVRASAPQPIPEQLQGKTLFPTVVYRNVTLQVNFGPTPLKPLPFSCRMIQDAAVEDAEVAKVEVPKDGKYEVLFPVSMPGQGTFDWADKFLAANPSYSEISDRAIVDWVKKSGFPPVGGQGGPKGSNDRPVLNFGIKEIDDLSVRKVLAAVAPALPRNYVVMEVKANLLAEERKEALARFGPRFKKTARVMMGEPTPVWKEHVQGLILAEKRAKAEGVEKRKRALEESQAKQAAKKARTEKKEDGEGKGAEEEAAPEAKVAEPPAEIVVELTEEEKAKAFRKSFLPDISEKELSASFSKFSLPEVTEGFDSVDFEWEDSSKSVEFIKKWMLEKKTTERVEDLKPSEWFKGEWTKWQKVLTEWKKRAADWKNPSTRKGLIAKIKEAKAKAKKEAAGEDEAAPAEEEELPEINMEDVEVTAVEDVNDVGSGEPLYSNFAYQDWALLSLRFELHLLALAFRKDLDDPERIVIPEKHVGFYFQKYFSKSFSTKAFACDTLSALVELVQDTIELSGGFVKSVLAEDSAPDAFIRLAEEHRRDRQRRVDAGDETAELKFTKPAAPPPRSSTPASAGRPQQGSSGRAAAPQGGSSYGAPRSSAPYSRDSRGAPPSSYSRDSRGPPPSSYGRDSRGPPPSSYGRDSRGPPPSSYGKGEKRPYASSAPYDSGSRSRSGGYSGGGGGYSGGSGYSRR